MVPSSEVIGTELGINGADIIKQYFGEIRDIKTGKPVGRTEIFDVDGIVMQNGQNFVDNNGKIRDIKNTNTVDQTNFHIKISQGLPLRGGLYITKLPQKGSFFIAIPKPKPTHTHTKH